MKESEREGEVEQGRERKRDQSATFSSEMVLTVLTGRFLRVNVTARKGFARDLHKNTSHGRQLLHEKKAAVAAGTFLHTCRR